ncbi:MAG: outer membrane protein assembly factor BamD [Flavobacteriales bacterium]|nr:outer membrane protein assembly factor BamD [Flavobacteriales bacterium]
MIRKTLLFSLLICLFSCGEYQKVLKSSDANYKYEMAVKYYENGDFNRAMPLFRELTTMLRATKKSEEVIYYLAYCHYNNGDFITSSYLFKNYIKTFPNGSHVEECSYMGAYCVYLESPSYSLDATYTKKAIDELQQFINMYPISDNKPKCEELISELHNKLALKSFENAKQYYTTQYYKSAIIALNNVLIDYPGNKYREEIHFLILKSSYELAIKSISTKVEERLNNTLDAFLVFNDNYPESKYIKQAEKINQQTTESINKLKK